MPNLRPLVLLMVAVVLLSAHAVRIDAETPPASKPQAADPSSRPATFIGQWQTSYGKMKLASTAAGISGAYGMKGTDGTIQGTLDAVGRKLTFTYAEPQAKGDGWFELSADGKSFAGKWRPTGAPAWQDWAGKLIPPPDTYSGLWKTSFGPMRLTQTGKEARGSYQLGRGATMSGQVDGRVFKFTYEETGGAKGEGSFSLSEDGTSFSGSWKQTAGGEAGGKWEGTRAIPKEGVVWLVVLEARWERNLEAPEYTYGDMLRAFFARVPGVQMRHRFITDEASVRRWCDDVKYIPEPVVLYFASHGTKEGPVCDGKVIPVNVLIECVKDCDLKLLHFGACEVAAGDVPKKIIEATSNRFPVSGFINPADWGGSAVVDFTYLELIMARGMDPVAAGQQTRKMLSFAREQSAPGDAISGAGLVVIEGKK